MHKPVYDSPGAAEQAFYSAFENADLERMMGVWATSAYTRSGNDCGAPRQSGKVGSYCSKAATRSASGWTRSRALLTHGWQFTCCVKILPLLTTRNTGLSQPTSTASAVQAGS